MKKALITGANGFIGSKLVKKLITNGIEVIALDHEGCNGNIPDGARFIPLDLSESSMLPEIVPDRDIDVIYHMAWSGSSGTSRADYVIQTNNIKCTCDVIKMAAEMGIKRFVGAGTIAQMDCIAYIGENGAAPNDISCYGSAKLAAQYMSKAIANAFHIEHIWCLISNIYGVGDTTMNFVNFAAKKMLSGEHVSFTAAEQNRDFTYIDDTIKGLYLCGKSGTPNFTYYIGSGKARQLKEYIKIIRDTIDPRISLSFGEVPFNGKSLPMEAYDCHQTEADTGYHAEIDFEDGTRRTVEWLQEGNNG